MSTVTVTAAQRLAAQTLVERSKITGRPVRRGIELVAGAKVRRASRPAPRPAAD